MFTRKTYADLIVRSFYLDAFQNSGSSVSQNSFELNAQFSSFFYERRLLPANQFGDIPYNSVPKLFTPLSTVSLESAGILQVQTQPVLSLTGTGVIIGFVDTGIDYTHPAFRKTDGTTRLLAIWDQTDRAGAPPAMFPYGSEYTKEQIDEALRSENPLAVVPAADPGRTRNLSGGRRRRNIRRGTGIYRSRPRCGSDCSPSETGQTISQRFFLSVPGRYRVSGERYHGGHPVSDPESPAVPKNRW